MANYDYLSHFNFKVIFKSTKENINANCYSRVSLSLIRETIHILNYSIQIVQDNEFDKFVMQIKQLPVCQ